MSAQSEGATLADFGASVPAPAEDNDTDDSQRSQAESTEDLHLGDFQIETGERTPAEWKRLYHRKGEDYERVVDAVDEPKREVLGAFVDLGIIDRCAPFYVRLFTPEDAGLSALNCIDCGERGIGDHPCGACGFDPRQRGGGDD